MQPRILTAATIILAASAFFALTPQLQMLQQNSDYNTRYLSYLRTAFGWRSVLAGIGAALLVLFLWIPVWNGMVFLILAALFSAIRGSIGKSFFKEYQKLSPLSAEEIDRYRLAALILRRHWNIAFEEPYLTKTIRALIEKYGAEEKETIE